MVTDIKAIKDLVVCSYYGTSPNPTKFSNNDVKKRYIMKFIIFVMIMIPIVETN